MSEAVITVENLGKKYRLRHQAERQRYTALRDVLADRTKSVARRVWSAIGSSSSRPSAVHKPCSIEDFWALKDLSFEVKQGEVAGIIGRNGAGKSTLLKILSRITEPTTGRVHLRGRVASLLEVGTGFHPELTGRENIFLNGAILGMARLEIKRKFDEIVAFAEVEQFLDTPVKRYSSGMYVRLAFAVAAHLEPEILIVDEVLAVGDAEFQKKCLGKMHDVAEQKGRTVLFVSHNMQAVQSLCGRAILIEAGRIAAQGPTQGVVAQYLAQSSSSTGQICWDEATAPGNDEFKLLGVRAFDEDGAEPGSAFSKSNLIVEFDFVARTTNPGLCVGFDLNNSEGVTLLRTYQTDQAPLRWPPIKAGRGRLRCTIPKGLLNAGVYFLCPRIGIHNVQWIVNLDPVIQIEVTRDHAQSPLWNSLTGSSRPGLIAPILLWTTVADDATTLMTDTCNSRPSFRTA
jgi:lipopolysaccharide transport system ATP-binding protein